MAPNQLHPLEVNPKTREVFLRLRKHPNIIITPMRYEDAPHVVPYFNDWRVAQWLLGPPYPYLLEHSETYLRENKPAEDLILQELKDAQGAESLIIAKGCPVSALREVYEDGTDHVIGSIAVLRCPNGDMMHTDTIDRENADKNVAENNKLEAGDPNIVWSIGDYLAASHHRQGIMKDAVDTIMHEWAIPRMGVRKMIVVTFAGNEGSRKVFERNGFKLTRTFDEYQVVKGRMTGLHVLEWSME